MSNLKIFNWVSKSTEIPVENDPNKNNFSYTVNNETKSISYTRNPSRIASFFMNCFGFGVRTVKLDNQRVRIWKSDYDAIKKAADEIKKTADAASKALPTTSKTQIPTETPRSSSNPDKASKNPSTKKQLTFASSTGKTLTSGANSATYLDAFETLSNPLSEKISYLKQIHTLLSEINETNHISERDMLALICVCADTIPNDEQLTLIKKEEFHYQVKYLKLIEILKNLKKSLSQNTTSNISELFTQTVNKFKLSETEQKRAIFRFKAVPNEVSSFNKDLTDKYTKEHKFLFDLPQNIS